MPKYRTLTSEELGLLEKEFVEFLVVNGITADEWLKIKAKDSEKTAKLLDLFSDVVFEKLMRKTQYVTKQMGQVLMCFHYEEQAARLILAKDWTITKKLSELTQEDILTGLYSLSSQTKAYQKTRELELFQLIQGGAEISDGQVYNWLSEKLLADSN